MAMGESYSFSKTGSAMDSSNIGFQVRLSFALYLCCSCAVRVNFLCRFNLSYAETFHCSMAVNPVGVFAAIEEAWMERRDWPWCFRAGMSILRPFFL